jgi:hypothetical protein
MPKRAYCVINQRIVVTVQIAPKISQFKAKNDLYA